jgi:antitoxin component HigA of HigAB toxin-antitoxin module
MDAGEENYFDAVTAFVEAYDDAHAPPRGPDARTPTERLRALLEEAGLGVNDLAKIVGNRPLAHHLIVGRREPSKEVCRKLGAHFKMNPGYFL